jgi:hypothetical protein
MRFALLIAAWIAGAAADAVAAECFTYHHECRYVPGEPDRRSLRDQLKQPIWAPEPPAAPARTRPELSQPYYRAPLPRRAAVGERRSPIFRSVEPAFVPMPLLSAPRFAPRR